MGKPRVLVFSAKGRDSLTADQCWQLESCSEVRYVTVLNPLADEEIISLCRDVDYIGLTRRTTKNFHSELINALPQLKGLSLYATGTEWVDQAALSRRQIQCRFLPDYSRDSVAEHTIGMLLTLSRRIHLSDRVAREDLPRSVSLRGWEVKSKTVGIVGMGRIGQRVAELLQGFGVGVVYFDIVRKNIDASIARGLDSQEQVLSQSDIVILCASMNRDSPTLIAETELNQMQAHAVLLNPGRAELVDREAILQALKMRRIAAYAIDDRIFAPAEIAQLEHGRLLQTGHTA
jgi:phosphoglycerate dehydrogenase-like enzyme